jgi:hypothetical protein
MLLVRSYHTFAPLPASVLSPQSLVSNQLLLTNRRYISVALSSRSPALGVTQQVWSFGSPDFPQIRSKKRIRNHLRLLFPSSSLVANKPKLLAIDSSLDKFVGNKLTRFGILGSNFSAAACSRLRFGWAASSTTSTFSV